MAMRWEKKLPDSVGLWAYSATGDYINGVDRYNKNVSYRDDFYYCKLENLDIEPPLKELGPAEIIVAINNKQEILIKDSFGSEFRIIPCRLQYYNDKSYTVYTNGDSYPYIPCGSACNFYEAS